MFKFCASQEKDKLTPSIDAKLKKYSKANPSPNLFIHYDKNVYSNNEMIYFTAYLINTGVNPVSAHRVLAVEVIRDLDSVTVASDKFSIFNGFSLGSITLPDSIITGNYKIVAYTNQLVNGLPEVVFTQPITIKTNIDPPFNASIKLVEQKSPVGTQQVLIAVTSKENRFLPAPVNLFYKYGKIKKSLKTDVSGQALINIPIQYHIDDPNIYVKLKYGKDSSFINMAIPYGQDRASVKFYPEGGNLVQGLVNTIGWEVKDQKKMPLALKAFLYKNNIPLDTIETSDIGIGKFQLMVEKDAVYTLKLLHDKLVDSVYLLPEPISEGLNLSITEALAKDTLRIRLRTTSPKDIFIFLHNFKETFMSISFAMDAKTKLFKIPLTELPKGLMTLTITDQQYRPLAERMVFTHYDNAPQLNIDLNQSIYNQREKVSMTLSLKQPHEQAIVSIAVVQDNRLELKKMNDIESYSYLKSELNVFQTHLKGLPFKDKSFLEQIFLVKGWRKYTWEALQDVPEKEPSFEKDSLTIRGTVTKKSQSLLNPITIGAFGDSKIRLLDTDSTGHFNVINPVFIGEYGKKMYLFINDPKKISYKIKIDDSFSKIGQKLKTTIETNSVTLPSTLVNNSELLLKSNEKSTRLKEVIIKGAKDNSFVLSSGPNSCGDWVCLNDILNCKNHGPYEEGSRYPTVGRTYTGLKGPYRECKPLDETFVKFNGIHLEKEFYMNDYKDPQEPAFFSTIYWNYATSLKKEMPTEISFYTSDITGKFRVVVQGISNRDVIYSEKFFEVKGK